MAKTCSDAAEIYVENEGMREVLLASIDALGKGRGDRLPPFVALCRCIGDSEPGEISWDALTLWARNTSDAVALYAVALVAQMLDSKTYVGDHSEKLYSVSRWMMTAVVHNHRRAGALLCGPKIESVIPLSDYTDERGETDSHYLTLNIAEKPIRDVFAEYARQRYYVCSSDFSRRFTDRFSDSLGPLAFSISGIEDFCGKTFWAQANYYRTIHPAGDKHRHCAITSLVSFYRYIDRTVIGAFDDSPTLTSSLVNSPGFVSMLDKDFWFGVFTPGMDVGDRKRICLITYGYDRYSTRMMAEDYIRLDISCLDNPFYRHEVLRHAFSSVKTAITQTPAIYASVAKALQMLSDLKSQSGYPNPDIRYVNAQEATLLKEYVGSQAGRLSTKNNVIGAIRRFFLWEVEVSGSITVDDTFFDYLRQYEEPSKTHGRALSNDDIAKLDAWLQSQGESIYRAVHTAFRLAVETEFRISQICHLKTDCLIPGVSPDNYVIRTQSKTSHGAPESYAVTKRTASMIQAQIDATEDIRLNTTDDSLSSYVFLYRPKHPVGATRCLTAKVFRYVLSCACKALDMPLYSAANLRDTHMTLAQEHVMRAGKSDMELGVLSRHRHLDTTKNHYVDQEFKRMLEATGGVLLDSGDDIGATHRVVDNLSPEASNAARTVEGGCGACTAPNSCDSMAYECRVCKHFRTTPAHERFWYEDIERQKEAISDTDLPHVREDRLNLIRIDELYLLAIEQRKGRGAR